MSFVPMLADRDAADVTEDTVLGGRLRLRQPVRGHRVGHDAILLAASTIARPGQHAVDLGAGVGAAGLALATRVPKLSVSLVEIEPALVALAEDNVRLNGLPGRAIVLDVGAPPRVFADAGLLPGCAACVLMNPPFNDPLRHRTSPDRQRRRAHAAEPDTLAVWLKTADRLLAPDGVLTMIWRADGLDDVLAALARHFGDVAMLPVYPRPAAPAIRIIVRARKASRAPLTIYPGLVLNDAAGRPTGAAEAVLRAAAPLPLALES
jgi:tRNA1(Val) A37 N6-methylase TrmN6